ncbi:MAG: transglycosylase SLT domain-containing protein [Deltaproteobacteria bacterium]|nr:transglycosylase SLT domain-containing protein [Deltaproteobacteria bacterium]
MKCVRFIFMICIWLYLVYPGSALSFCFDEAARTYNINPLLLQAIATVESNNHPYAINVNKNGRSVKTVYPTSKKSAIEQIKNLDRLGYNYDIGIGQINVKNIKGYGMDPKELFEPCKNLHASAMLLKGLIDRYGYTWDAIWRYNGSRDYALKVYEKIKVMKKNPDISK